VGIKPADVVVISEYTGGGFGSKSSSSVFIAVAALLSKKANAPVMMRISRDDEHAIGRARPAIHSRVKIGFRKTAASRHSTASSWSTTGPMMSSAIRGLWATMDRLSHQPLAMRWRALNVLTNTPPRGAQRSPGGYQASAVMEPILAESGAQAWHR
jgi:CO/xanthine dehydrogenase Mo-binding subunit